MRKGMEKMRERTFDDFLQEKFADSIAGTDEDCLDDEFHDRYCDWLDRLPIENVLFMADDYAKDMVRRVKFQHGLI
jgi:hypothetical protein